ncbi:hypothetical protein [Streptomyces sp. ALB3]
MVGHSGPLVGTIIHVHVSEDQNPLRRALVTGPDNDPPTGEH